MTITSKKLEITVKDSSEEKSNENNKNSNELNNKGTQTTTTITNTNKSDSTSAVGILPKTGENFVMISMLIVIAIVLSIIFYKKYMQHKDIK